MSTMASQNDGIETPSRAPVVSVMSSGEPRRTALTIPTGMPMRNDQTVAQPNSSSVIGSRCANICSTGWPVPREVPQLPRRKSPSQPTNCCQSG